MDLTDYTCQGAAFVPYSVTREEITQLRQIAFKKFYSRPCFLARRVLGIRSLHDIRAAFTGFKSLFWVSVKRDLFRRACSNPPVSAYSDASTVC
jgi:hypothetical protein